MCVGKTLNMDSCSKFWRNLEGNWGNPGEIPHIGWKIPGVYRVKCLRRLANERRARQGKKGANKTLFCGDLVSS